MKHRNGLPWRRAASIALALIGAATIGLSAPEAGQYEQPPSFQAGQVLPPNVLRSPNYTVGNQVGLDNFQYVFRLDTEWGPFTIRGSDLLRVRAREIAATAELVQIDSAGTLVNAAGRTALKPLATAKDLVTAPGKTIGDTFKGVGNLFGSVDASMAATDPNKEKLIPSLTGGATARRKLAYDFGVDPNTRFAPLDDELTRLATANAIGETTTNAGFAFVTGGAGIAISVGGTSHTLRLALRNKTAAQLEKEGRQLLASMGVPGGTMDAFYGNPNLSPTDKAIIVAALNGRDLGARDLRRRRGQRPKRRDGLLLPPPGRADRAVRQERRAGHRVRAAGRRAHAANRQRHGQRIAGRLSLLVAPTRRSGRRRRQWPAVDHRTGERTGDVAARGAWLDGGAQGRRQARRVSH